jgi:hypothetical protein
VTSEAIPAKPARASRVSHKRLVGLGYALYVALDETKRRPRSVPPLLIETEADRAVQKAAQARQATRLAHRAEARGH